jgi:signal transduction histidine kinase
VTFPAIPSLRWRLVAIMCMAYILVAAVTEVVAYRAQYDNLHHQLDSRARADAIILAAGAVSPLASNTAGTLKTLRDVVTSLTRAQGVSYAAVYGGDGCTAAATSFPPQAPRCVPINIARRIVVRPNGDVEGWALVANIGTPLGLARVVLSSSSVQSDLNSALFQDLLLRGIGLVIFFTLTLLIAQYILGPLTDLARAARAIRHGRLSTRIPSSGHTEVATVADAFNDMASALEQRIRHLSFLAATAPDLPAAFRDDGDAAPALQEFCRQLDTCGVGLLSRDEEEQPHLWYDARADPTWHAVAIAATEGVTAPTAVLRGNLAVMVVPVLGDAVFVTARDGAALFAQEEQQVITNFAYQVAVAADNARLFAAQQEALQVKDQFLSIVSHELRTPLTSIKGYAQMVQRKYAGDPDGARYAANIENQVERLKRLVDDLLDVTRFSRGQFDLRRQRMDLRPLLEDAATRFRMVAPEYSLVLDLDQEAFTGEWDRDRLEQVLNNLIGNAVKYSPPGGTITIGARRRHDSVVVAIRDQGIGISSEDQRHLFERFYRGNASGGSVTGLGLGLYVTRRIVEAHGGTIEVHSRPGEGSEFAFSLPLTAGPLLPPLDHSTSDVPYPTEQTSPSGRQGL